MVCRRNNYKHKEEMKSVVNREIHKWVIDYEGNVTNIIFNQSQCT